MKSGYIFIFCIFMLLLCTDGSKAKYYDPNCSRYCL